MKPIVYVIFMPFALGAALSCAWVTTEHGDTAVGIMFSIEAAGALWIWCIELRDFITRRKL